MSINHGANRMFGAMEEKNAKPGKELREVSF